MGNERHGCFLVVGELDEFDERPDVGEYPGPLMLSSQTPTAPWSKLTPVKVTRACSSTTGGRTGSILVEGVVAGGGGDRVEDSSPPEVVKGAGDRIDLVQPRLIEFPDESQTGDLCRKRGDVGFDSVGVVLGVVRCAAVREHGDHRCCEGRTGDADPDGDLAVIITSPVHRGWHEIEGVVLAVEMGIGKTSRLDIVIEVVLAEIGRLGPPRRDTAAATGVPAAVAIRLWREW